LAQYRQDKTDHEQDPADRHDDRRDAKQIANDDNEDYTENDPRIAPKAGGWRCRTGV
jgi:hypothetical protein